MSGCLSGSWSEFSSNSSLRVVCIDAVNCSILKVVSIFKPVKISRPLSSMPPIVSKVTFSGTIPIKGLSGTIILNLPV